MASGTRGATSRSTGPPGTPPPVPATGAPAPAPAAPAAVGAVPPPTPPRFALTPARVYSTYIDYSTRHGQRLYETATQALPQEYDCDPMNLRHFVDQVKDREYAAMWNSTTQVPKDGTTYALFESYGLLTTDAIRAHALTYIGTHTRDAQNSYQMYECLNKSITVEAAQRVSTLAHEYTINGVTDGLLYFKAIVKTAQIDTRATISHIRDQLSSLDQHMQTVDSDIVRFNTDVKAWLLQLTARGAETTDILNNMFKGYLSCQDAKFVTYIEQKKDAYNENVDFTVDELMELAANKYRTLVQDQAWKEPTEDQKKIVALTAKLGKLEKANKRKKKKGKGKNNNNNSSGGDTDKSDDGKKEKKVRKYPDWKYQEPKDGEPRTKTVNGRTLNWCKYHKLWVAHKEADCNKQHEQTGTANTNNTNNTSGASSNANKGSNLQLNQGMMAMANDDGSI